MRVSLSQRFVYQSWFKLLVLSYSLSWNSETLSALYDWWPFRMECVKNKWKAGAELWVPSSGKLMHATFNWWLIIIFALVWYFILISFTFNPWSMIYDTYLAAAIDCSSFDPIVRLAIFGFTFIFEVIQCCKKAVCWYLGYRTLLKEHSNIFK